MANNEIGGINALALNNNRPRLSLFWPGLGTDSDNNKTKVSGPKDKEPASANEPAVRRRKRRKEELIRLDDLIPKKNVKGGRQLPFGVTDTTNNRNNRKDT